MNDAYSRESGNRWSRDQPGGAAYSGAYLQDAMTAAADKVKEAARKHGIQGHAAAIRWARYHSALSKAHGDAVIIGASKQTQLEQNLEICEQGPLPEDLVQSIESAWSGVETTAPWAWMDPFAQMASANSDGVTFKDLEHKS